MSPVAARDKALVGKGVYGTMERDKMGSKTMHCFNCGVKI